MKLTRTVYVLLKTVDYDASEFIAVCRDIDTAKNEAVKAEGPVDEPLEWKKGEFCLLKAHHLFGTYEIIETKVI
jgi:hypothetical protein